MSAREELAQTIASNRAFGRREFGPAPQDYDLTDALIAEGYRKVETTTEYGIRQHQDIPCHSEEYAQYTLEKQRKSKLHPTLIKREVTAWEVAE